MNDNIVAIATPSGRGAIGLIRMSGPGIRDVLKKVWISRRHPVENFVTHRLYLGKITDLSTGLSVDQVLASLMMAPHSYTGEDVIEVSCHGGRRVLEAILDQLLAAGARLAEPGEFTKRAFLNGKMDLAQAEAVAQLIDSKSRVAATLAEEQLEGRLSRAINSIQEELKRLLAYVEATIDFPEEDEKFIDTGEVKKKIILLSSEIKNLIKSYDQGRVYKEGVKTVIAGPPNAGKSSLLNALIGSERAIVHHIPGTTRDTIEEEAIIEDVSFRFIDTAGIREAEEEVEEIGVSKSRKEISSAEVVILVLDGNDFRPPEYRFIEELKGVRHVVIALNKKDIGINVSKEEIERIFGPRRVCEISAKSGDGVKGLARGLVEEFIDIESPVDAEGVTVTSGRHFMLLTKTGSLLGLAAESAEKKESPEFIAHHLRGALDSLGEITGVVTTDDVLNEIFSSFCIGK